MNVSNPEKHIRQSGVLQQITTPAETAAVLCVCYPDPLEEVARRAAAEEADGADNQTFWSSVKKLIATRS